MEPVAERDQVWAAWWQEKQDEVVNMRQGSGSRPESARGVWDGSPQNCRVNWLSHKTKTRCSAGRDEIRVLREASMPRDTRRDHGSCVGRTRTAAKVWSSDEGRSLLDHLA
jgi:hypothetical protein